MYNETVVATVSETYDALFKTAADPRVENWYGFGHPFGITAGILTYLYLVCNYFPNYMKHRKPYNIQRLIQAYNIFQVVACSTLVYEVLSNGWSLQYSLHPISYDPSPKNTKMLHICWYNFILKSVDLIETVFFVLRKKQNQVTGLHLYHHCTTLFFGWMTTQFMACGCTTFTIILNTSVHVLMYAYYFLSTLGPHVQEKMTFIKSKLTTIQMVQFWLLAIHTITFMKCNKGMVYTVVGYLYIINLIMNFSMFLNFYMKSYTKVKSA